MITPGNRMPLISLRDIRRMRTNLGLTQKELADRAGVSQPLIARIENEDVDPRWSTLQGIVRALEEAAGKERTLDEIMTSDVISVREDTSIREAIDLMKTHGFSQLPVVEEGRPVGTVSERGIVHAMGGADDPKNVRDRSVSEVMGDALPTLAPDTLAEAALELIETVPAVLVVRDEELIGVVTRTDLLNLLEV